MSRDAQRGLIVSDFNAENFAGYLGNDDQLPEIEIRVTPYGQVIQSLASDESDGWRPVPDFLIVWTRPEGVLPSFAGMLEHREISVDDILDEVRAYAEAVSHAAGRVGTVFVPTWVSPSFQRGLGPLDMRTGLGVAHTLMRMNLELADRLRPASNVFVLNAQRWIDNGGRNAFNPKLWYMAKVPFGSEVFKIATGDVKAALRGISGKARKLVVVDLDDTLWGGIVGDIGWENLQLGGHDPVGEAFVDFQKGLKSLLNRGVILGIVSKNQEDIALETMTKHSEMVLKPEDFAGWRINWGDKAANIVDLASDLNLGLQSVVFIDDNPVERSRVREALPEVLVPEWPKDKMAYGKALASLDCFDTPSVSSEDRGRAAMYAKERQRKDLQEQVGSVDDWLQSLDTIVKIVGLDASNITRTVQLLNKTNQMNLTTRRTTEIELAEWVRQEGRELWTFRVADKFGDSGLTGIASAEIDGSVVRIVDFVLSCRVMGRKVEEAMVSTLVDYARSTPAREIRARYLPTRKNKPCLEFWLRSGFRREGEHDFRWSTRDEYPRPRQIRIV